MAENFQDNVTYGGSTLAVKGDAVAIGTSNAGAKSVIFASSDSQGHLAWLPSANRTINLPDAGGTVMLTSQGILSLSAGGARATSGEVVFSNSNNVSFGLNGQTVTATITVPAQTNQTVGLYGLGNTTQNSSTTLDARTLSFNGLGMITVGYSNGSIQLSATQTNQTVGLYGLGNTTQNSSTTLDARTISFNGLGIVTVGYSNGSVQISASQTVQTSNIVVPSAGTQTATSGTVVWSNSNNMTFGMSGSSRITASFAVNVSACTTSNNLSALTFANSNGVTFGLNAGTITASAANTASTFVLGISTQGNTLGTTGFVSQSYQLVGTNGITLSQSVNGQSATLTISGITTSNASVGLYALGNTTQNSSTTLDGRTISFNALGAMTWGYSNGSVQVSAPATSSLVGTLGASVSTNGSTISIIGEQCTNFENMPLLSQLTTTFAPGVGSWYVEPFYLPGWISGGRLNRMFSFGNTTQVLLASSSSFGSGTTGSMSARFSFAYSAALYSLGAGTNSTRLESLWSNTFSVGIDHSVSVASGGATTLTVTNAATISYVASIDSAGNYTTTTYASSTAVNTGTSSMNISAVTVGISSILNMLSGQMVLPVGFNTTVAPGNYWLAGAYTTASTTTRTSAQIWSVAQQPCLFGQSNVYRIWGQTTSTSGSQHWPGVGVYSSANTAPPTTMAFSDIRSVANNIRQYFNIVNSTI